MFRKVAGVQASCFVIVAAFFLPISRGQGLVISTVAGNGAQGFAGDNGPATRAQLWALAGLAVDAYGNVFVADTGNCRIRKVTAGGIITTVAGNGIPGYAGDGGPAVQAELNFPRGVAVDAAGNLYIADTGNARVRRIGADGTITTVAGNGTIGFTGDGSAATNAELYDPWAIALDAGGNLFIVDRSNQRVRKLALDGTIATVAGNGTPGYSGDGGPATAAALYAPDAVAPDAMGNVYVSEALNNTVRKVAPDGTIKTVVGNGSFGYSGDGGPAVKALLNDPQGLTVDAAGNLYIADEDNQRIRMVTPDQTIATVAGTGSPGFSGDGGPAANSAVNLPEGLAAGPNGIYFVDSGNKRVRVLTAPPSIKTGGVVSASDFGQFTSVAPGSWIEIYGFNLAAGARSWTGADFSGVNAPTALNGTAVTIGGKSAYIAYVASGQVDAQVPADAGTGSQQVIVTSKGGPSAPSAITVNATAPGLFAPASFKVGGKQYLGALFPDGVTYALPPGEVAGVNSHAAKPGDTITLYGVGFGPVDVGAPAGQIVQQSNSLTLPLQMFFGGVQATLSYSGLAPGEIGLYQFNVVVPAVSAGDAVPVTFTLGGAPGVQSLYIAIQGS